MQTKVLYCEPKDDQDEHRQKFVEAFDRINSYPARIFSTYTHGANNTQGVAFITTDKRTHLGIGLLDEDEIWHLGQLVDSLFDQSTTEIVLSLSDNNDRRWLVTRTESVDMIKFTLHPA